ncbi:hypothetical protein [Arboricoccus pini]|uniref:hypothetical protein n=1 Tax=Arboricoccus pini TaxID=1963835 RepID=UPI000B51470F|nr:hypothetical protein [Arboricoccus pini]
MTKTRAKRRLPAALGYRPDAGIVLAVRPIGLISHGLDDILDRHTDVLENVGDIGEDDPR